MPENSCGEYFRRVSSKTAKMIDSTFNTTKLLKEKKNNIFYQ